MLVSAAYVNGQSLKLGEAYSMALKSDPKTKSASHLTKASEEYIQQNKAKLYPQVQGSVSWGYYDYDAEYLNGTPVKESYTSYSLSASQALYHPEYLKAIDESKARVHEMEYRHTVQMQELGVDVAKAYFDYMKAIRNLELTNAQKEYNNARYNQMGELLKVGLSNKIDVLEAKVHRDKSVSEWMTDQKRLALAKFKLESVVGEKVDSVNEIDFETLNLDGFRGDYSQLDEKLNENPYLNVYIAIQEQARHRLAAQEYDHYPKVDLNLARKSTYTQDRVAHKYDNQAIVQVTIPIYQGGATESRIRGAIQSLAATAEDVEFTRKDNRLRLEAYLSERSLMINKIVEARESIKGAELFVESVKQGHDAGLKSIVDVLEANTKLYVIKRDIITSGFELIDNELSLLLLAGELNEESIAQLEVRLLK